MKQIIFFLSLFLLSNQAFSQCAGCILAPTCPASRPTGGLCRGDMKGMVSKPYSKDINFYMPKKINCADIGMGGSCTYVNLKQIKIASVTSPPGISTTANKTTYNVIGGDTLGCIRFCGTPLSAGVYLITVNLLADITAFGTPAGDVNLNDQAFPYVDTIIILADTTSNPPLTSFDYKQDTSRKKISVAKACDSITIDSLRATINGDCNLVSYQWNIEGKGNFTGKNPNTGKMVFKNPDTITVKLTTQLYNYRIKNIVVGSVTGGYREGVCIAAMEECLIFSSKYSDLYMTIDVAAFNNRRNCGNAECGTNLNTDANVAFNNLNLVLPPNKCSTPFKLTLYDEDSAPYGTTLGFPENAAATADDKLDEYNITPTLGMITLPNGSNTKTVRVTFDTVPAGPPIVETMNIIVHPPVTPTAISSVQDSFCNTQSIDLNITNVNNYAEWFNDTALLTGQNNNTISITKGGAYKARLTSPNGCKYTTPTKIITALPYPDALTEFNKDTLKVQGYDTTKYKYEWYIDNTLLTDKINKPYVLFSQTGFYKVKAYNKYCSDESDELYYKKPSNSGIEQFDYSNIRLIQNFTQSIVGIDNLPPSNIDYTIMNTFGQLLLSGRSEARRSLFFDISTYQNNLYFLNLFENNQQIKSFKFIK
jgi:hypothetical protein